VCRLGGFDAVFCEYERALFVKISLQRQSIAPTFPLFVRQSSNTRSPVSKAVNPSCQNAKDQNSRPSSLIVRPLVPPRLPHQPIRMMLMVPRPLDLRRQSRVVVQRRNFSQSVLSLLLRLAGVVSVLSVRVVLDDALLLGI